MSAHMLILLLYNEPAEEATFSAQTAWTLLRSLINPSPGLGKLHPESLNYLFVGGRLFLAGVAPLCG